jgi:hypothetical protein
MRAIINLGGNVYTFEGWTFEYHSYLGPWPLNANGSPRDRPPGKKFFCMFNRFMMLTADQKNECMVRKGGSVWI